MIKQYALLKRKNGTTIEQLIDHYESKHAPLSVGLVPNLKGYVRHYLRPFGTDEELPYDVITEIHFDDQEDFDRGAAYLSDPKTDALIREDERRFLETSATRFVVVENRETTLNEPTPTESDDVFKLFAFMKRKSGTTREELIDHYENNHAPLSARLVPNLKRYVRHYITPLGSDEELPYDVIGEVNFIGEEDFQQGLEYLSDPETDALIREDERRFCEPAATRFATVEDRETTLEAK